MIYNLSGLTSLPDVESMLESTNGKKAELISRKAFLEDRIQSSISNIASIQEDLAEVNTAINLFTTELAALELGSIKFFKKTSRVVESTGEKKHDRCACDESGLPGTYQTGTYS